MNDTTPKPDPASTAARLHGQPLRELQRDGVHYTLLGTAHVSHASVEAVKQLAAEGDFDTVAVELCATRLEALEGRKTWKDLDLFRILRERKAGLVMANLALSGYQQRIAEQFGIEPGAELKAAASAARDRDLELQLVDRDLATTLRRTYRAVPWYKRLYLTSGLVLSSFSSEEIFHAASTISCLCSKSEYVFLFTICHMMSTHLADIRAKLRYSSNFLDELIRMKCNC